MKTLSAGESLSLTNFQVNSEIPCERLNALNEFVHAGERSVVEEMFEAMNEAFVGNTVYHRSADFGELKMRFTNPFNH